MKKTIGELIKELGIENKLTQKEFGDKFFLSSKTISNYDAYAVSVLFDVIDTKDIHYAQRVNSL